MLKVGQLNEKTWQERLAVGASCPRCFVSDLETPAERSNVFPGLVVNPKDVVDEAADR
jgi:hypothetical protein